jgi:branched-chain amino acid transport system substrate-binding protein
MLAACYGSTQPVVKIGLIAPFEELYRADGYAALHAVRLAVEQRNAAGGVAGRQVALVALNDNGRADEAALQARKLGLDQDVMGVIGPLQLDTARGAAPEFARQELPWIAPLSLEAGERPAGFALSAPPEVIGQQAVAALARRDQAGPIIVVSDQPAAVAGALAQATSLGIPAHATAPGEFAPDSGLTGGAGVWLADAEHGAGAADAMAAVGGETMVGGSEIGSPVFRNRVTESLDVRWLSSGLPPESLPEDFVATYLSLAGTAPTPQVALIHDSANMLLDAMALAAAENGQLDRPAVARTLADIGADGWQGLSGRVAWNSDGCPDWQPCGIWQDAPVNVFPVQP